MPATVTVFTGHRRILYFLPGIISLIIMCIGIIMTALCNRAGHYIFALWFLSIFFLFSLAYSQSSQIGCLPYFHTWCGLSANLRCRSERAASGSLKVQDTQNRQKFAIYVPSHNFVSYIFATKARIDNRKSICQTAISPPHVLTIW